MSTRINSPARTRFRLVLCLMLCAAALYLGGTALQEALVWLRAYENGTEGGDLVKIAAYGYSALACALALFFIAIEGRDRPIGEQEWREFDAYMARWKASRKRRRNMQSQTFDNLPVALATPHTTLVRAAVCLGAVGVILLAFALAIRQGAITSPIALFALVILGGLWALAAIILLLIKIDRVGAEDKNTS